MKPEVPALPQLPVATGSGDLRSFRVLRRNASKLLIPGVVDVVGVVGVGGDGVSPFPLA